jgi:hypothetical protein
MSLRTINKKHCQTLPAELFITLNKPTLLMFATVQLKGTPPWMGELLTEGQSR